MSKASQNPIEYHSFGCKVNTYDTGLIQKQLVDLNLDQKFNKKIYILNTCAVTKEATKEAVRLTRKIKRQDPNSFVVVTGCSAQIDKADFDLDQTVDLLVGNSHKEHIKDLIQKKIEGQKLEKFYHKNIFRKFSLGEGGGLEDQHSRSFLKIQDGCDSFCSFCVIPHTRGKSRSLELDSITERIKEFILMGQKEVVITGIHLGDYKDSKNNTLEDMVEAILERTTLPRLRLTSLEPLELTDRLLELCHNDRVCSHFHMSIQSASDKILKLMKRKYTKQDVLDSLKRAKSVTGAFVGMDVIVGFPSETQEDFLETYEALKNSPHWDKLHVFPYSERPKTGATLIDDSVPLVERKRRSAFLRALSQDRYQERIKQQVGRDLDLLVLKSQSGEAKTLSSNYWPVKVKGAVEGLKPMSLHRLKITEVDFSSKKEGELFVSL